MKSGYMAELLGDEMAVTMGYTVIMIFQGGYTMLRPSQVSFYAKKAEKKNQQFRTWLKTHVDPDELDKQFLELHNELFSDYDCSRCRNCCKEYRGSIPEEDLERDATFLHVSVDEFKNKYLKESLEDGGYSTRNVPCDFLDENCNCILGDCIPQSCVDFPYTDKPDRMGSLLSFLGAVSVCPVAYEICERLKGYYGFR